VSTSKEESSRTHDGGAARLAPRVPVDYAQIKRMVEDREGHVLDFSILPQELQSFWDKTRTPTGDPS
jgi:hypothetical protein